MSCDITESVPALLPPTNILLYTPTHNRYTLIIHAYTHTHTHTTPTHHKHTHVQLLHITNTHNTHTHTHTHTQKSTRDLGGLYVDQYKGWAII